MLVKGGRGSLRVFPLLEGKSLFQLRVTTDADFSLLIFMFSGLFSVVHFNSRIIEFLSCFSIGILWPWDNG